MAEDTVFDALIVYSERLATSADSLAGDIRAPFAKGSSTETYNIFYGYFLEVCRKYHLKAALTTSADITGAGRCNSFWIFENKSWVKVRESGYSKVIFDKFSPVNQKITASRDLLFSSGGVKPFNDPDLFNLFFDKQKTHKKLPKFSIPTATVENGTRESLNKAGRLLKARIKKQPQQNDFSDEIIMKDRFGAGGRNVYKFKAGQHREMMAAMNKHQEISFVIQPLVKFEKGFSYQNCLVPTDIRLIYFGKKIIQTYIRMAKPGEFRCNEHQGGSLIYIAKNEVPREVVAKANKIAHFLNKKDSLFTLDFIISNNGNVYLLEGNTGPGLDWNLALKENELEAKRLIRFIVKELVKRVRRSAKTSKREVDKVVIETPISGELQRVQESLVLT